MYASPDTCSTLGENKTRLIEKKNDTNIQPFKTKRMSHENKWEKPEGGDSLS
jgi:hypothetical protein